MLGSNALADLIEAADKPNCADPLVVVPAPDPTLLRKEGTSSIDLRLGTWFLTPKKNRHALLDVTQPDEEQPSEHSVTRTHFVPFGRKFYLHPHSFVLAATLEWIRMPLRNAAYVTGKSSWGRRGLVIETAPGIHPGFSGCLTLELANVGEIPIALTPGTKICQLFIHSVTQPSSRPGESQHVGRRRPTLLSIRLDRFAERLALKGSAADTENDS